MQDWLDQIERAQANELYLLALGAALTIPDVCGALMAESGWATKKRYIAWYEANVLPRVAGAPPVLDVYAFRCSLLHQGQGALVAAPSTRVLFIEPGATSNVFLNCELHGARLIDQPSFVAGLLTAARSWLADPDLPAVVRSNLAKLVARHPSGIAPYIIGVPVIG